MKKFTTLAEMIALNANVTPTAIAIKAASTSDEAKAKLRVYEMKLFRLIDENADLRELIRKLMPEDE